MKVCALLLLVLCASLAFGENVIVGTADNFEDLIESGHTLVEFYAPWCGHCKNLAPEYEAAATTLAEEGSDIKLVMVDATVHSELAQEYEVKGYPTLIFFSDGEQIAYDGDRKAPGIVSWLKKKSGPASAALEEDAVADFTATEPAVLGRFADEDSKGYKAFVKVARGENDFSFGHVFGGDAESVVVYVDGKVVTFDSEKITKTGLKSWLHTEGYPSLVELNQQSWTRSSNAKINLFAAFFPSEDKETMAMIQSVAIATKGKVLATFIDSNENGQLAERWGASGSVFPTVTALIYEGLPEPKMFVWNEDGDKELNEENILAFIDEAIAGTYESFLKSEPIPEDNNGPVTVVVGNTFEDIVFDANKDVLVEFYAPWCGHCKKLTPIYEELGEKFAADENIVIAKIDATANGYPSSISVQGFPTILFFPAGSEEPITFSGDRTLEELSAFVAEKASNPVNVDL